MLHDPGTPSFDFEFCHIDAGGTLASTTLARHAKIESFLHLRAGESCRSELARYSQPQRVGPAAGHVSLVLRHAIARTHGARVELPAVTVVAHLHCRCESLCGTIGACSGQRFNTG